MAMMVMVLLHELMIEFPTTTTHPHCTPIWSWYRVMYDLILSFTTWKEFHLLVFNVKFNFLFHRPYLWSCKEDMRPSFYPQEQKQQQQGHRTKTSRPVIHSFIQCNIARSTLASPPNQDGVLQPTKPSR